MGQDILWVWNGWGILFISIVALISFLDLIARGYGSFLFRTMFGYAVLILGILTFVLSSWIAGLLFLPIVVVNTFIIAMILGIFKDLKEKVLPE